MSNTVDRRSVLVGAAVVAAGATITACSSSSKSAAGAATSGGAVDTAPATAIGSFAPSSASSAATSAASAKNALGKTADIPVGGGKIYESAKVVVTQPTAGVYKAFSAVCTHQGCLVADISNGNITCPCHGSSFSIKDGSVTNGPATSALADEKVSVSGDSITLA